MTQSRVPSSRLENGPLLGVSIVFSFHISDLSTNTFCLFWYSVFYLRGRSVERNTCGDAGWSYHIYSSSRIAEVHPRVFVLGQSTKAEITYDAVKSRRQGLTGLSRRYTGSSVPQPDHIHFQCLRVTAVAILLEAKAYKHTVEQIGRASCRERVSKQV